jgi:acetyl esterase/lipase
VNRLDTWGKYLLEELSFTSIVDNFRFVQTYHGFNLDLNAGSYISGKELIELDLKLRMLKQATESGIDTIKIPNSITLKKFIEMKFLNPYSDEHYQHIERYFRAEDYGFLEPYEVNDFNRDDGAPAEVDAYVNHSINKNKKRPVIVYIHGGGWVGGDKSLVRKVYARLVQKFVDDGSIVLAINYRLLQNSNGNWVDGMEVKKEVEDVHRFLTELSEKESINIGGQNVLIDTSNISVFGGSAGGHLSLMTSFLKDENGNSIVKKIASIVPVAQDLDIVARYAHAKGSIYYTSEDLRDGIIERLGSVENKLYLSAISHIHEINKDVKITLFHALNDDQTPSIDSVEYYEKSKAQGLNVKASYSLYGNHGYNPGFMKNLEEKIYDFFSEK